MIGHAWLLSLIARFYFSFVTHQIFHNNDGIRIYELATSKLTRKGFPHLVMHEIHYVGGVLFISGKDLLCKISRHFC